MPLRRRVLISLHAAVTPASLEQALASLGPGGAEEIVGLFIEDVEILNLGSLPVAREIRYDDATPRAPDIASLERQLRAHAARIRSAFEQHAGRMSTRYSFRVMRGPAASALLEASSGFDVLLLASARDRLEHRWVLRGQLPGLLAGGPRTLMIVQPAPRRASRIAVLYEDTPAGRTALETAAELAARQQLALIVMLAAPESAERGDAQRQVEAVCGDLPDLGYRYLTEADPAAIAGTAARERLDVLVLPRQEGEAAGQRVAEVLDRVDCSVIVTG